MREGAASALATPSYDVAATPIVAVHLSAFLVVRRAVKPTSAFGAACNPASDEHNVRFVGAGLNPATMRFGENLLNSLKSSWINRGIGKHSHANDFFRAAGSFFRPALATIKARVLFRAALFVVDS